MLVRASRIADFYSSRTNAKITITDGDREAKQQAEVMYKAIKQNDTAKYVNKKALNPILEVYQAHANESEDEVVEYLTFIIETEIESGVHISKHLSGLAFDVRNRDMTDQEKKTFEEAVQAAGGRVLPEGNPPHFHVQFSAEN